jgi:hypothetical protein
MHPVSAGRMLSPPSSTFRADWKVTLSLGTRREDGVKSVSFRISHRPDLPYEKIRQLSIVYDKISGQLEARLMVEVKPGQTHGAGRVAIDLGETIPWPVFLMMERFLCTLVEKLNRSGDTGRKSEPI